MKNILWIYCLFYSICASAQFNNQCDIFAGIKPRTIKFDVSFNVRVRNDKGEVIALKNIMNIPEHIRRRIDSCDNKSELIHFLKSELNNGRFDWESNIFLYYIKQEDCLNMFPFQANKVNAWLKSEKENCIKFWQDH
ncbi:MAG: hypothetical protein H7257_03020 [Taibaiella sp.]|nr:hypothetical protein [Taibaiella sp.]